MATDLTKEDESFRRMYRHFAKIRDMTKFDVRSYVFEDLAPVYFENRQNRLKPEDIERWMKDRENYRFYKDNIVLKTCIAKYWAQLSRLNYDYDDSLFSTCVFEILSQKFFLGKKCMTKRNDSYPHEYVIVTEDSEEYRGDTMNSWTTTLDWFCYIFGGDYLTANGNELRKVDHRTDDKRWLIPKDNDDDIWYHFLCHPKNYGKDLPSYITEFIKVVYTIGNFIPAPKGFQKRGAYKGIIKDYWDLTLLAIYYYYCNKPKREDQVSEDSKEWLNSKWLDSFKSWNEFVERNFMQPFVDEKQEGCFGRPRELWDGHFTGDSLPKTPEQFEQFFVNAKVRILARGRLMAAALKTESEKN